MPPEIFVSGNITSDEPPPFYRKNQLDEDARKIYQIVMPLVFGIIVIFGFLGNMMVIYVISTRRKLRSTTNFLLLNLAVADILFLTLCGPVTIAHYVVQAWVLGDVVCRTVQYFLYVTCYVTVYTLVAVAAVRYTLVVKRNLKAASFINSGRNVLLVIFLIWIVCLSINVPVPLFYGLSFNEETNRTECVITLDVNGQQFFIMFFVFSYALPLVTIATLYMLLVRHIHVEQSRTMIGQNDGSGKPGDVKRSSRLTRVVLVVICVFAFCWLPLQIHLLWGTFGTPPNSFAYRVCLIVWHALVFLNSALNPLIYNFFSVEFRSAFRSVFPVLSGDSSVNSGSTSRGALIK